MGFSVFLQGRVMVCNVLCEHLPDDDLAALLQVSKSTHKAFRLLKAIQQFRSTRLLHKKTQYDRVLKLGLILCGTALVMFLVSTIPGVHAIVIVMAHWLITIGIMELTVCASDELDFDTFIASHPRFRTIGAMPSLLNNLYASFTQFPYFLRGLAFLANFWSIFGGKMLYEKHFPKPVTMIWVYSFLLECLQYGVHYAALPVRNTQASWPICMIVAAIYIIPTVGVAVSQGRVGCLCIGSSATDSETLRALWALEAVIGAVIEVGMCHFSVGIFLLLDSDSSPRIYTLTNCYEPWLLCLMGFGMLLVPFVVFVSGRDSIYGFLARRLDFQSYTKDGAFLAELFNHRDFEIGDIYWIPCDSIKDALMANDIDVPEFVENFCPGVIRSINSDGIATISLDVSSVSKRVKFKMTTKDVNKKPEDLLGSDILRCVDWKHLTMECMTSYDSTDDDGRDFFELSRPLMKGEHIDFFVTHSWLDDHILKWQSLVTCAENFKQARGRYPTFWLDKYCLRHGTQAADGLKMLCKIITSCDRILVLCGPTFSHRLWCAWEIFTSFAFQSESHAIKRVVFVPLDAMNESNKIAGSSSLRSLECFDVNKASCYDPNDELVIKNIIDNIGRSDFNKKVRRMARRVREYISREGSNHICVIAEMKESSKHQFTHKTSSQRRVPRSQTSIHS